MIPHPCLSPWKGAVAGGLIAFAWTGLSWHLLPWHGAIAPAFGSLPAAMALGLVCQGVGGFFWTWILGKIPGLTTKDAALYGFFFGLCVGFLGLLPLSVWEGRPAAEAAMGLADACVSWTIASVVIARWCQASVCALPTASR